MQNALPRVIDGWFAVGFSDDLRAGAVRVVDYMGRSVAIFRTQSGRIAAADGFCPHLGASFATMGRVVGEELVCNAHGFHFDGGGACTKAYGRSASNVRLPTLAVREQLGVIFVWYHHAGAAPSWDLPDLVDHGWSKPRQRLLDLATHPQEILENAADVGHFEGVHGLSETAPGTIHMEGHHLSTNGTFTSRQVGPFEKALRVTVSFRFDAFGLGLGRSEASFHGLDLRVRAYAAPTPREDGRVDVRCWTQVYDPGNAFSGLPWLGRMMPKVLGGYALTRAWDAVFAQDFAKDIVYWTTKRYLARPALARLDKYIGPYRKWAKQFYVPEGEVAAQPVAEAAPASSSREPCLAVQVLGSCPMLPILSNTPPTVSPS